MYPVTLTLIQKFFTDRVHGNFHVPCNTETNSEILYGKGTVTLRLIPKFFPERAHGNFHVPCNIETNSVILYQNGPWKFPCSL